MTFSISFRRQAAKQLAKIEEPLYARLKEAIINLSENPRPIGYKKLKGREGFRIRIGDYRVIYQIIESELIIEIVALGHRKDIYK